MAKSRVLFCAIFVRSFYGFVLPISRSTYLPTYLPYPIYLPGTTPPVHPHRHHCHQPITL